LYSMLNPFSCNPSSKTRRYVCRRRYAAARWKDFYNTWHDTHDNHPKTVSIISILYLWGCQRQTLRCNEHIDGYFKALSIYRCEHCDMVKKMAAKGFVLVWKDRAIMHTICVSWAEC
jgi:hypothetical protein